MPLYARPEQQSCAWRRPPLTPCQIDTQPLSRRQARLPMESSFPSIHSPRLMSQHPAPSQLLRAKVLRMASLSMFDTTNSSARTVEHLIYLGKYSLIFVPSSISLFRASLNIKEHVHFLKSIKDARAIRMRILECGYYIALDQQSSVHVETWCCRFHSSLSTELH